MPTQDAREPLDLLQGTLDLLILRTLIFGPEHGQGIARAIQQTSRDELLVEHGALYPALQRLEKRGWITAEWGTSKNNRKARFYALTAAGRKQLAAGRWLNEFDKEGSAEAAVINESAARMYWPNEDPIGKRVQLSLAFPAWVTIVVIAGDARIESLENAQVPAVFTSLYQRRDHHLAVMLRGTLEPAAIERAVRDAIQGIDPSLPVFGVRQMDDVVAGSLAGRRFALEIVGMFAIIALVLAALGIYGVLSFLVAERTREIGIRLALGAKRHAILGMVLREGVRLAVAGTLVGLAGALLVARGMAQVLYGIGATDAPTFAAMALLLVGVALGACYVPARRALKVNPILALRLE